MLTISQPQITVNKHALTYSACVVCCMRDNMFGLVPGSGLTPQVREETDREGEGWHTARHIFVVFKVMPFAFMPWMSDECTMFSICDTGRASLPFRGPSAGNSPDRLI